MREQSHVSNFDPLVIEDVARCARCRQAEVTARLLAQVIEGLILEHDATRDCTVAKRSDPARHRMWIVAGVPVGAPRVGVDSGGLASSARLMLPPVSVSRGA